MKIDYIKCIYFLFAILQAKCVLVTPLGVSINTNLSKCGVGLTSLLHIPQSVWIVFCRRLEGDYDMSDFAKKMEVQQGLTEASEVLENNLEVIKKDIANAKKELKMKDSIVVAFGVVIVVVLIARVLFPV